MVLNILRKKQLFAKLSKYSFGKYIVEYLEHIITEEGVATYPSKIEVMANSPTPITMKALRGFLG